jgi:hypothetical protein
MSVRSEKSLTDGSSRHIILSGLLISSIGEAMAREEPILAATLLYLEKSIEWTIP